MDGWIWVVPFWISSQSLDAWWQLQLTFLFWQLLEVGNYNFNVVQSQSSTVWQTGSLLSTFGSFWKRQCNLQQNFSYWGNRRSCLDFTPHCCAQYQDYLNYKLVSLWSFNTSNQITVSWKNYKTSWQRHNIIPLDTCWWQPSESVRYVFFF